VTFDHIVIGGGTSGSVVATRLSEDRGRHVLLLEAGEDYASESELPAPLIDGRYAVTSGHNWDLQAIVREESFVSAVGRAARVFQAASDRLALAQGVPKALAFSRESVTRIAYPLGKVMGGGSSVNGAIAYHARPEDFAAWVRAGNGEWAWEKVQPFMRRIEAPIENTPAEKLTRLQRDFLSACVETGAALIDSREGTAPGVGITPKNLYQGRRASAVMSYLSTARGRSNLTIRSRCLVDKLILVDQGGTLIAKEVQAVVEGQRHSFAGEHIVLAAGAIQSAAILMRSGIGPASEIARAGGTPRLDLPGVGKNLMDHPAVFIWGIPEEGVCPLGEPIHQVMLQQCSTGTEHCDLQLYMHSAVPTSLFPPLRDFTGAELAMGVSVVLATPASRGRVELVDLDPLTNPRIYLNCARERSDLRKLMEGARLAWRLLQAPALRSQTRRIVIWNQKIVDSDELLEQVITSTVRASWHAAGTLRMGAERDEQAVVDQYGRLRGCKNITVADASIMPVIPSVPTSLTCLLIGERISSRLREE